MYLCPSTQSLPRIRTFCLSSPLTSSIKRIQRKENARNALLVSKTENCIIQNRLSVFAVETWSAENPSIYTLSLLEPAHKTIISDVWDKSTLTYIPELFIWLTRVRSDICKLLESVHWFVDILTNTESPTWRMLPWSTRKCSDSCRSTFSKEDVEERRGIINLCTVCMLIPCIWYMAICMFPVCCLQHTYP